MQIVATWFHVKYNKIAGVYIKFTLIVCNSEIKQFWSIFFMCIENGLYWIYTHKIVIKNYPFHKNFRIIYL